MCPRHKVRLLILGVAFMLASIESPVEELNLLSLSAPSQALAQLTLRLL